jgi:hypothetical protein
VEVCKSFCEAKLRLRPPLFCLLRVACVIAQAWPAYALNLTILPQMLRTKQGGCLMAVA